MATPEREVEINSALVERLLEDQHPDLASLPLSLVSEGWDNVTLRLGEDLAVRVPRRAIAVALIESEQRWLPELARHVTAPIPAPMRVGVASLRFPWPWSIVRWIEGTTAGYAQPNPSEAPKLGATIGSIHTTPPADAPDNPHRGRPLPQRVDVFEQRLTATNDEALGVPVADIRQAWHQWAQTPIDVPSTWIHGDLHPKNVLVRDGQIAGIIDWGDICAGDPATDLSVVWSLFDPSRHSAFWEGYGSASAATRDRARCWALDFAVLWIVDAGDADPEFVTMGRRTLQRLFSD